MVTVKAVHTFVAEHDDELEFQAGEDIEVLERDDGFGDGWWRGRNPRGEEGLFPATYIAEDKPAAGEIPEAPASKAPEPVNTMHESKHTNPSDINVQTSNHVVPENGAQQTEMGQTIASVQHAIESMGQPEPTAQKGKEEERDLNVATDTRARLAEQAKLANEDRDRQRESGNMAALIYSDESDDEEETQIPAVQSLSMDDRINRQNGDSSGSPSIPSATMKNTSKQSPATSHSNLQPPVSLPSTPQMGDAASTNPPSQWTVDEVVSWAQSKGFDEGVCERLREHEITGDLLLELDANLLKELDIPQFGKRLRIAQAIGELRQSSAMSRGMSAPPSAFGAVSPSALSPMSQDGYAWNGGFEPRQSMMPPPPAGARAPTPAATTSVSTASVPTSPTTPSSSMGKRESVGSMGHKKGKASIDNRDRLSFFSRNRKPAPHSSPGENARLSSPKLMQNQTRSFQPEVAQAASSGSAMRTIGSPDYSGYMKKKGERYATWKTRFFVLKGPHLYYMKNEHEDKVKGDIDLRGYRVIVDENANPGSYGFRLVGNDKPHYFSSSEQTIIRGWMKAIIKATIARDYTVAVTSSCNIPTIPLAEAQAMSPRPPSPATREATQRASRRENTTQLTAHDASVLMSLDTSKRASQGLTPSRPSRDGRRPSNSSPETRTSIMASPTSQTRPPSSPQTAATYQPLLEWVNANLPPQYPKASSLPSSFTSGEVIFLVVRHLSQIEPSPPVPPNAFAPEADGLPGVEGLFAMMDLLIDAGIDTAGVSINDVRSGDAEGIARLVESVKSWQISR